MEIPKILLIEDNRDHAELFIDTLDTENIKLEVILMKDGQEAIDYFQKIDSNGNDRMQHQISLVVLDLNLPKVHGMNVLKFIKKSPDLRSIPVVILSKSYDIGTISKAYKNGASEYIAKPVSYQEYAEKVKLLKQFL